MMQWVKMLASAFAAIFAGAVISTVPPLPRWFEIVNANQTSWLIATAGAAVTGFVLMMGGILDLLMAQNSSASSEEFTFHDVKQAWRSGAWRREVLWRRRFITSSGALLLAIGLFGIVFTLSPPAIKSLVGLALLYACVMLLRGFWLA